MFGKTIMPYPILTLPFPFAQRLRQLLSPSELQNLQKAAGHNVVSGIKPIVSSFKESILCCKKNHTTDPNANPTCGLYFGSNLTGLPQTMIRIPKNDQCVIECNILKFYGMSHLTLKSLNTGMLSIKVFQMHLHKDCHISNALLKQLSRVVVKPDGLSMWFCHEVDENVTFSTILNIFPSVNNIALPKSYFGWLNDLASMRRQLTSVVIDHHDFDKIFSFGPEELYDFCVNQNHPTFRFHLMVQTDDIKATLNKIKPFIDPRFDTKEHGDCKVIISVQNDTIRSPDKQYFFKNI